MRKAYLAFALVPLAIAFAYGTSMAQCRAVSSAVPPGYDYLVRLAVHFGDALTNPCNVVCSRSLLPGETVVNVPIWAYNLHEGMTHVEFSVVSNESLGVFIPDNCFSITATSVSRATNGYRRNLVLDACGAACGPVRLGYAQVVRTHGYDPVWIDLQYNTDTGLMMARDASGGAHSAFSPKHGGYMGQTYLYACQPPICEEPNASATSCEVIPGGDCRVKVRWTAGGGNVTMVRWSTHRYPTGIEDGHLAFERPTVPGQFYYAYHVEIPTPAKIYYTVFSLTRDASGAIVKDSFVECTAVGSIIIKCEIATQESSWGAIKSLYR